VTLELESAMLEPSVLDVPVHQVLEKPALPLVVDPSTKKTSCFAQDLNFPPHTELKRTLPDLEMFFFQLVSNGLEELLDCQMHWLLLFLFLLLLSVPQVLMLDLSLEHTLELSKQVLLCVLAMLVFVSDVKHQTDTLSTSVLTTFL
jgi:hypothetical protein